MESLPKRPHFLFPKAAAAGQTLMKRVRTDINSHPSNVVLGLLFHQLDAIQNVGDVIHAPFPNSQFCGNLV